MRPRPVSLPSSASAWPRGLNPTRGARPTGPGATGTDPLRALPLSSLARGTFQGMCDRYVSSRNPEDLLRLFDGGRCSAEEAMPHCAGGEHSARRGLFGGRQIELDPGVQHIQDPAQHRPVRQRLATWIPEPAPTLRQQRLHTVPELVRHDPRRRPHTGPNAQLPSGTRQPGLIHLIVLAVVRGPQSCVRRQRKSAPSPSSDSCAQVHAPGCPPNEQHGRGPVSHSGRTKTVVGLRPSAHRVHTDELLSASISTHP